MGKGAYSIMKIIRELRMRILEKKAYDLSSKVSELGLGISKLLNMHV